MRYKEPQPISRDAASHVFETGSPEEICDALIGVTFHDPDWRWVQDRCLEFLSHESPDVGGLAATCLGHIARIHGALDQDAVVPALQRLRRQFISLNRQTAVPAARIKESFVGYLNDSFQAL